MLRTPRQNRQQRELASEIIHANGSLFAPTKRGTPFEENRDELVRASALKSLDANAKKLLDACLEESQGLRL